MQDQVNASRAQASPVEQAKTDRSKTAAATQARLVDSDEAPDRGPPDPSAARKSSYTSMKVE
jgi:hypothetical protein